MKKLGIYFGLNAISAVESDGKKVLNSFQIPLSGQAIETKVNVFIQDELRRHGIKTDDAVITLASRDLIVRSFDLPVMPANELAAAINSEATKYIPFKIEDITYDYKVFQGRKERKNYILFVGIKTEDLDSRYLSALSSAMLKPKQIEYAVFSMLKLIKASGMPEKGTYAFIDIDLEDESNITILNEGFPQFSRTLKISPEEQGSKGVASALEKLNNEIRISLDFYRRKFPAQEITKAVVMVKNESRYEIENIFKELGISPAFIDFPKGVESYSSLGIVKAYCASLDIKQSYDIDLMEGREKLKARRKAGADEEVVGMASQDAIKVNKGLIFLGVIVIGAAFAYLQYSKIIPLKNEIVGVLAQRKPLSSVSNTLPYTQLSDVDRDYKNKVATLDKLLKDRQLITPKFDYLPKLITDGVWLTSLTFAKDESSILIEGAAFLEDSGKEIKAINDFVSNLNGKKEFSDAFPSIIASSVKEGEIKGIKVTLFTINCRKK